MKLKLMVKYLLLSDANAADRVRATAPPGTAAAAAATAASVGAGTATVQTQCADSTVDSSASDAPAGGGVVAGDGREYTLSHPAVTAA